MNGAARQGFQFTPFGLVPLGSPAPVQGNGDDVSPGAVPQLERLDVAPARQAAQARVPAALDPGKSLDGKQLVAVAKARIAAIKLELRKVPALQAELAQLSALVLAARPRRKAKAH